MTSFRKRVKHSVQKILLLTPIQPLSGQQPLITHLSTQKLYKYFSLLSSIPWKNPFQIEWCRDTQEYEREAVGRRNIINQLLFNSSLKRGRTGKKKSSRKIPLKNENK